MYSNRNSYSQVRLKNSLLMWFDMTSYISRMPLSSYIYTMEFICYNDLLKGIFNRINLRLTLD